MKKSGSTQCFLLMKATEVLVPYPDEQMAAYTVSRDVNKVNNNNPELIIEKKHPPSFKQGNLFEG